MQTIDQLLMSADPEAIYQAATRIERWPAWLAHYRWVSVLGQTPEGRLVEMAARQGWIPVKWQSEQICDPEVRRIFYRHLAGLTRGMRVLWLIEPQEQDGALVSIIHELSLQVPLVRTALGRWIVGYLFVKPIARRTLRGLKRMLERQET